MGIYNGSAHIKEQLDSILAQYHCDWELWIRDDVSNDDSLKIVKAYAKQDSRIILIQDDLGKQGALGNFSLLMEKARQSSSGYFAFSDQDDVWFPDKLSSQIEVMDQAGARYPEQPLLVHSDLEVVDASLGVISSSLMKYQGICHRTIDPLRVLLTQNFVTGCTMVFNRKLLEMALPVPANALMHDWWVALCAAVFGHILFMDRPLIRYRQHGDNAVGAKSALRFLNPFKANWRDAWLSGRKHLTQSIFQSQSLSHCIMEHDPSNPSLGLVKIYGSLLTMSPVRRLLVLKREGIRPQARFRQVLAISRILFLPGK